MIPRRALLVLTVLLVSQQALAQAPRTRAEAAAFCYDVIRYTAGGGTDQRYRMCMFDLGYPVAKSEQPKPSQAQ
jgi:hypothetical protein